MTKFNTRVIPLFIAAGFSQSVHATLTDNGNGLVYDSTLNITWTAQTTSLFQDMAASNSNLLSDIIAANNGVIHDNPADPETNGSYSLSSSDFSIYYGTMDWWGAQAWIGYLNNINYDGFNNWRLPTTNTPVAGNNQTGSEMSELYYTALGLTAGSAISTSNPYYNLFSNLSIYWSGTDYSNDLTQAWYFNALTGNQSYTLKDYQQQALAVLPGNASVVPVPAASWLFMSSLGLLLGLGRTGNRTNKN